jgi:hypothetical protein
VDMSSDVAQSSGTGRFRRVFESLIDQLSVECVSQDR